MSRRPVSVGRSVLAELLAELPAPPPRPPVIRRRRRERLPQVPPWAGRAVAVGALASAGAVGLSLSTATVAEAVGMPATVEPAAPPVPAPSREELAARAVEALPDIPPLAQPAATTLADRALVPVALPGWRGVGELWSAVVPGQEGRAVVVLPVDPTPIVGLVGNGWAVLADGSEWRVTRLGSATESDLSVLTDVATAVPLLTLVSGIAGDPRPFVELRKVTK